jgi:hypothetical protein
MDGQRVNAAREFAGEDFIYHAVALDAGLSFEGIRHDIDPEMGLPARPVSGMAFVPVGFVFHLQALRGEGFGQLLCDNVGGSHAVPLGNGGARVNAVVIVAESRCGAAVKS